MGLYLPSQSPAFIGSVDELRKWVEEEFKRVSVASTEQAPTIVDFGAREGEDVSKAIYALIQDRRLYLKNQIDTIGGNNIDMYAGVEVLFPDGEWTCPPNTLLFTQEFNVRFKGTGFRGFTNAMQGRCSLIFDGSASAATGFGIKIYRGGARSFSFEQMDITYATDLFQGRLVHNIDSPNLRFYECYLGTFPNTGAERDVSADALVSVTYDEGFYMDRCVLNGCNYGILFDDVYEELGNSGFGGWGAQIQNTVIYDCTGAHVKSIGNRARYNHLFQNVNFNPLNVAPPIAFDIQNFGALSMIGNSFLSSVASAPSDTWMKLKNTGAFLAANTFGSLANAIRIEGTSHVQTAVNQIDAENKIGLHVKGGLITGGNDRYYAPSYGILVEDDLLNNIAFDMSPSIFKVGTGNSIKILTNSSRFSGIIRRSPAFDNSTSGVSNASANLSVVNI